MIIIYYLIHLNCHIECEERLDLLISQIASIISTGSDRDKLQYYTVPKYLIHCDELQY